MRRFRACLVVAALVAFLSGCNSDDALRVTTDRPTEQCDQRCEQQLVTWYWASSLTAARQWYAWQWTLTPHFQCVVGHESINAGYWAANDGSGNYGAVQYDQPTWDSASRSRDRLDLVGVRPDYAPWWEQALNYATTYTQRGDQPWGGMCGG